MPSENEFVADLLRGLPPDRRLEVPVGDDAAVLRPPAMRRTVVTVDMLMEGTDFVLGPDCPPEAVGHKALAVSLSDLAAMGSRPEAAVVAVALPRRAGEALGSAANPLDLQVDTLAARAAGRIDLNEADTLTIGAVQVAVTRVGAITPSNDAGSGITTIDRSPISVLTTRPSPSSWISADRPGKPPISMMNTSGSTTSAPALTMIPAVAAAQKYCPRTPLNARRTISAMPAPAAGAAVIRMMIEKKLIPLISRRPIPTATPRSRVSPKTSACCSWVAL